jgi:hypothetical protein
MTKLTRSLVGAAGVFAIASSLYAAPILVTRDFSGNDCVGTFNLGAGFETCDVGGALDPPQSVSPVIAKGITTWQINSAYPTIDGSEFSIVGAGSSGTWTYTPGPGDPAIRYWVAKGGDEFRLHWMVEDATVGTTCDGDPYNLACLNLALVVTSGTWSTPGTAGLSHMTFYDTEGGTIPEPGIVLLLGAGLIGVAARMRRRR